MELGEIEACLHCCDFVGSAMVMQDSDRLIACVTPPGSLRHLVRDATHDENAEKTQRILQTLQEPSLPPGFSEHRFLQFRVGFDNQLHWERKTSRSFGPLDAGLLDELLHILAACNESPSLEGSRRAINAEEAADILAPLCGAQYSYGKFLV